MNPAPVAGLEPAAVAAGLAHLPGFVFFDTAGHVPPSAKPPLSVIAADPARILRGSIHAPHDAARLRAAVRSARSGALPGGIPPGGLCGWVDYEGCFVLGEFHRMLVYSHRDGTWWDIGSLAAQWRPPAPAPPARVGAFHAVTPRAAFLAGVRRIKDWIAAGDIYQANLSQAFTATVSGASLFGLYQQLRAASPAPMAAYLALDHTEVLSSSPELFLATTGREIETRPIKGTRPRSPDPADDLRAARGLVESPKESAELVMITDLLRNDLGQVCEYGSVRVKQLLHLESFAQVHHLVSTVTGTLRGDADCVSALAACFPGGSITGAPKKRAMEIIREVEGRPRGIYCGALGWLGFDGACCFNIAIRTLVRRHGRLVYQVGAGIVADSDPLLEYEETLHKAAGIRLALDHARAPAVPPLVHPRSGVGCSRSRHHPAPPR